MNPRDSKNSQIPEAPELPPEKDAPISGHPLQTPVTKKSLEQELRENIARKKKFASSDSAEQTVTPTLVAEVMTPEPEITIEAETETAAAESVIPQLMAVQTTDASLQEYAILIEHYQYWAQWAHGSWPELEEVVQVKNNCEQLQQQLSSRDSQLKGLTDLQKKLQDIINILTPLQEQGPLKPHFYGAQAKAESELQSITQHPISLSHLQPSDYKTSIVKPGQAAFVQGRKQDGTFISEAYLTLQLADHENELREFVHAQIESFHASPCAVGKRISFQGHFTAAYLVAAINYCNVRGYAWDIGSDLKNQTLQEATDVKTLASLFNHERNDSSEVAWKKWLDENNKTPYCKLLDKKTVHALETGLQLEALTPAAKNVAKEKTDLLIKKALASSETPLETPEPTSRNSIIRDPRPSLASFSVSIQNKVEQDKEEQDKEKTESTIKLSPRL